MKFYEEFQRPAKIYLKLFSHINPATKHIMILLPNIMTWQKSIKTLHSSHFI